MKAEELEAIRERVKNIYQTCNGYEWESEHGRESTMLSDLSDLLDEIDLLNKTLEAMDKQRMRMGKAAERDYENEKVILQEYERLNKSNTQLQKDSEGWHKAYKGIKWDLERVQGENEEWKTCARTRLENIKECNKSYRKLKQENERLRQENEQLMDVIRESSCLYPELYKKWVELSDKAK